MDQNTNLDTKIVLKIDDYQTTAKNHYFNVALACKYSPNIAVVISQFIYWINLNKKAGKNFINGKTWTCQSLEMINAHFPYFTKNQIERIINKLVDDGVLVKGNFNKTQYDRTIWYAFKDENLLEKIEVKENVELPPNHIYDFYMKHLSGVQYKIVSAICRKTYGWVDEKGNRKTEDAISISQFEEITGCSRSTINEALQFLTHHKIIIKRIEGEVGNQLGVYGLAPFTEDDYKRLSKVFNEDKSKSGKREIYRLVYK